jgi:hypothetical protein
MRSMSSEQSWRFDPRDRGDLEDRVSAWLADHHSATDILSAAMLSITFIAMVIFALSR